MGSGEWKEGEKKMRDGEEIGKGEGNEGWMERIRRLERRSEWRE